MLKNTLPLRQANLVVTILGEVLTQRSSLDKAYARAFSELRLSSSEQAAVTVVTGDLLRRLNLYAALAGIATEEAATAAWSLLCVWHQFYNLPLPECHAAKLFELKRYESHKAAARSQYALWDGCPECWRPWAKPNLARPGPMSVRH